MSFENKEDVDINKLNQLKLKVLFEEKRTDFHHRHRCVCPDPLGRYVLRPPRALWKRTYHRKRRSIRYLFPCKGSGDPDQRYQCM